MVKLFPGNDKLRIWDAQWYYSLAEKGYEYFDYSGSNAAFYPLFSFIWRLTGLSAWGISFVNIFIMACGFAVFNSIYKLTPQEKFIWLSIPSMYFCFIPYSEAVFIFSISLSFLGIVKNKKWFIWAGLFLVSLSRSVSLILIPALIIAELIADDRRKWLTSLQLAFTRYVFPLLAGTALFVWYQHHKLHIWFAYFIQQSKHWGHQFSLPALPFNSLFGLKLLWLNALAMFLCIVSLVTLLVSGFKWLFRNKIANDKLLVLCYGYFAGVFLVTIFFNPKWGTNTTNVFDVHRYTFSTVFFWVFLYHYTHKLIYKPVHFLYMLLFSNACWLLFASYNHIQCFLYFNFCTLLLLLYMWYANNRTGWPAMAIVAVQVFIQIQMFQFFINDIYPG